LPASSELDGQNQISANNDTDYSNKEVSYNL